MSSRNPAPLDDREWILTMGMLLHRLGELMQEQSVFHTGPRMEFSLGSVRAATSQFDRRKRQLDIAGAKWLREILKTLASELIRTACAASVLLEEAGANAWQDLDTAVRDTHRTLRDAAGRDPEIFCPADFNPSSVPEHAPAGFAAALCWRSTAPSVFVALPESRVLLAVTEWGAGECRWLSQLGSVGIGLHSTPEAAARYAEAIHAEIFTPQAAGEPGGQVQVA